ncbi:MAG: hypothetical protein RLO52_39710 [Sandaracinaceae bacterium]|nr:MAG: hypothetical protein EVA89_11690 [Sandaracinaceae bacterium]
MTRSSFAAALLLLACGGEGPSGPPGGRSSTRDDAPPRETASPRRAAPDPTEGWLRELLAFDLRAVPTDARMVALAERLGAPAVCPQPGTGCYVELTLGGYVTQVHMGDDQALQVWGPTEPADMPVWVAGVEAAIDRSALEAVNETGTRPDRLWVDGTHVVLLHDHTGQPCGGFCPSMVWIAPPDHPSAPGYGFPAR